MLVLYVTRRFAFLNYEIDRRPIQFQDCITSPPKGEFRMSAQASRWHPSLVPC